MEKIEENGVIYYVENQDCVDLDVPDEIRELRFWSFEGKITNFRLKTLRKRFPRLAFLSIGPDVTDIEILNDTFPNVRAVYSKNTNYLTGRALIKFIGYGYCLLNSFCLSEIETLDVRGADGIGPYALDGCKTRKLCGSAAYISVLDEHAFDHSAFLQYPDENGCYTFGPWIIGVADNQDHIFVPKGKKILPSILQNIHIQQITFERCTDAMDYKELPPRVCVLDRAARSYELTALAKKKGVAYFDLTKEHLYCMTKDGILFSKDGTELLCCPRERGGTYQIPETVERIANYAFYSAKLETLVFSNTPVRMGKSCFSNCHDLKQIQFGEAIQEIGPEEKVFALCDSLEDVVLPPQVKEIGVQAFSLCKRLKRVQVCENSMLTKIKDQAFYRCPITHFTIPDSVTRLGECSLVGTKKVMVQSMENLTIEKVLRAVCAYASTKHENNVQDFQHCEVWIPNQEETEVPSCEQKLLIVPQILQYSTQIRTILTLGNFNSSEYRNLYRFAYPQVLRVELAFLTYQTFQDTESKAYVRKFGKLLATRLVAIKADKDLQALLSAGLLSKTALSAAREEAENTGNAIAQAYLLQETKSTSKKSTFSL